ncbi:unnamed protein product [Musa acuminata subsp. burmannicoides]
MGDEGSAETPATRKRPRDVGDLKRVAEIVMVLSAMGQMRGGREPVAAEKALVAEARERLVTMCEGLKPKELFSREAVRVVVEDLGLNRSKDPVLGFRPPKMSIAEKLLLTKKKMEESKETHMRSSVYSLQHLPVSFGAKSESHGPLAHDASRFMQVKSPMETSAGGFQISSPVAHAPVLTSAASSFKQSHISDVQAVVNPVKQPSGSLERGSSSAHVKLNAKPGGPSYLTQAQAENMHQKIPTISSVQSTPAAVSKFGQANKFLDHNSAKSEVTTGVNAVQSSHQVMRSHEIKPSIIQPGPGGLHIVHQPPQGLGLVHTPALFTNHNDIAKSVLTILQAKVSDHPIWTPPSTEHMNATINCQLCKNIIIDIDCLLICDACEKGNHLKCLQSYGNKGIPKAEWHCPRCLASSNGKPLPPKYGRVTRASVSAPKTAANVSVHASSKKTESLDTRVNEQKAIANDNSGVAQQAYSLNMEDNHCMSIPDSRRTGGEVQVIMTIIGSKREDDTLKAIDVDPLKEITRAVCAHPDMHSEDLNNIEDNRLSLVDAKPTSVSVLEPSPMPKDSCEHAHDMVVENNNLSEAPLTHDFDQVQLSGDVNASAIQLDENIKTVKSEPEAALGEKRSPECLDGCSNRLAKEGSCQTSDGDGYTMNQRAHFSTS